jgi:hypothetical protein
MNGERLPQKNVEWCQPGRRRRKGRPRNSWIQEATTGMREKGINKRNGSTGKNGKQK